MRLGVRRCQVARGGDRDLQSLTLRYFGGSLLTQEGTKTKHRSNLLHLEVLFCQDARGGDRDLQSLT